MHSIRWKLILMAFLLVFVPVYALNRYALKSFDTFTSRALEEEMISQGMILGEQYRAAVLAADGPARDDAARRFAATLQRLGPKLQSRIRVVSVQGIVLADSDESPTVGADVSGNREILKAMGGRYGARWELTPDRKYVYYYTALPILDEIGQVSVIAYVSHHTNQITKAILKIVADQRVALFMALLAAAIVSAVLAQTMTRRLRRLTRAASNYAEGEASLDLDVGGKDEIGELSRAVKQMAGEIESRNRYNRDFVSTVMHELSTPLTAIRGAAEVLEGQGGEETGTRAKFLSNIRLETERMNSIVGELNELTKLDTESRLRPKERIDYGQCVEGILERLEPTFPTGHARIVLESPQDPTYVFAMPGRLEQVFANLLDNAIRYTPPNGRIDVTVERAPDKTIVTTVRDSGRGIAASNLGKIFDRFFTTEPKGTPTDHGTGLGLAIVKRIVENHKGTIRVASTEGQGTTFVFTLPQAP